MICAIDFESYYDNDTSVSTMGAWHYARATDIYLVSMAGDDGLRFVGHPKDAPWDQVDGQTWIMHNAGFDLTLVECLIEKGVLPPVKAAAVHDTADMTAYLGYPRSLKEASHHLLGVEISKDVRDKMKKKQWATMTPDFQEEVRKYALADAENTLNLWVKHADKWPDKEKKVSRLTREMTMRGVPVNIEKLHESSVILEETSQKTRDLLPWHPGRPALSLHAVRDQCAAEGIWAPDSFAEKEDQAQRWEDEFADKFSWVKAMREHRKANKHLKTIQTMLTRTRPSGRMGYDLKYFGATTGRDSGSGGWNAQNLPRDVVSGVDIRSLIEAPAGKMLVVCDLSQIEARCILYLANDFETLDVLRTGVDVYEAHARATMGYTDPRPLKDVDKALRQLAKARVLGLGFGCGANKFQVVAKMMAGLEISPSEAERIVTDYRKTNAKIVALWRKLENKLRESRGSHLEVELPNLRRLVYRDISGQTQTVIPKGGWEKLHDFDGYQKTGYSGVIPRNGKMLRSKLYGGLLAENLTQAFARDIFMDRVSVLAEKGYEVILRVHDEVVCLVNEASAKEAQADIESIMATPPEWCKSLPMGAEATVMRYYAK
jgi:DNA polymerase I-like protein with 3'-5' exonuclease and polymerase domains